MYGLFAWKQSISVTDDRVFALSLLSPVHAGCIFTMSREITVLSLDWSNLCDD